MFPSLHTKKYIRLIKISDPFFAICLLRSILLSIISVKNLMLSRSQATKIFGIHQRLYFAYKHCLT